MTDPTKDSGFRSVPLSEVEAWPGLNPRISFDDARSG